MGKTREFYSTIMHTGPEENILAIYSNDFLETILVLNLMSRVQTRFRIQPPGFAYPVLAKPG